MFKKKHTTHQTTKRFNINNSLSFVSNRSLSNILSKDYDNTENKVFLTLFATLVVIFSIILTAPLFSSLPFFSFLSFNNTTMAELEPVSCSASHDIVSCIDIGIDNTNVDMELTPNMSSNLTSASNTLNTKTNAPGYQLFVNADTSNALEYQNPLPSSIVTPPVIPSTTAAITNPTALNTNTWGIALPGQPGFDASYTTPTPNNNSLWSGITDTPTLIKTTTTPNDTTGNNTNIYYGAKIDLNQLAGLYKTTITYTVLPNPFPSPTVTSITPDTGPTEGGTTITITGTNFYDTTDVTIDNISCTTITIVSSTEITCETPANATPGAVSVNIVTEHGTNPDNTLFTYFEPIPTCESRAPECIVFTVDVGTTGTYSIPTSGNVANAYNTYDWLVYVDDALTTDCTNGNCTGISSETTVPGVDGIVLNGLSNGTHQIKIISKANPTAGWGNAFGHSVYTSGANVATNKQKLITIDAPLTTMAFAPKSGTNAQYMFSGMFYNCTNLTTTVSIIDTYKLPNNITNLGGFLASVHTGNSKLTIPIDLSPLYDWFNNNTSITDIPAFLSQTHYGNSQLATPIDLSPLSGWFSDNTSITNLPGFFERTHSNNSQLATPIDLSPLSDWFNDNTSITYLSDFLYMTYAQNHQLITGVDLSPLSDWFNDNTSITNLSNFLSMTHRYSNELTTPIDLSPLSGWFSNNNSITNLSNFLYDTYGISRKVNITINLSPLSGWFSNNNSITNLSGFLNNIYYMNSQITTPIDLSPISGWFSNNTSITNLTNFLNSTHSSNSQINTLIDLTPLSGWFDNGRSFTSANSFLNRIHYSNSNLTLTGQTIFPNWIKTMTVGATPIWNVSSAFNLIFSTSATKAGDTGEPKFVDGSTLSSIGIPTTNNQAYTNRTGITPVNSNWK